MTLFYNPSRQDLLKEKDYYLEQIKYWQEKYIYEKKIREKLEKIYIKRLELKIELMKYFVPRKKEIDINNKVVEAVREEHG